MQMTCFSFGDCSGMIHIVSVGFSRYKQQHNRYITLSEKGADVKKLDLIGVQPPSSKSKTLKRLSVDSDVINVDGGSSMEASEAHSKFDLETEPTNAIEIEPANGFLSSEGFT
ncbi:hypothetical protein ACP4OV_013077 [Aristida adscensionis]